MMVSHAILELASTSSIPEIKVNDNIIFNFKIHSLFNVQNKFKVIKNTHSKRKKKENARRLNAHLNITDSTTMTS